MDSLVNSVKITYNRARTNGALNTFSYLNGTVSSTIAFGLNIAELPLSICTVSRYLTGSLHKQRIIQSYATNWYHGHYGYSGAMTGVAFFGDWITSESSSAVSSSNWVFMCTSVNQSGFPLVVVNGVDR